MLCSINITDPAIFSFPHPHPCALEMKREAGVGMHYVKSGEVLIKHWPVSLTLHSCVTFVKRRARSTQHYVKKKKKLNLLPSV